MSKLTKEEKLRYCTGCRDDFYNGKNDMGIKECWCLGDAKLVLRKKVGMNQVPPWTQAPVKALDCCHYQGYVLVKPEITC